jgi:hypothetical protein
VASLGNDSLLSRDKSKDFFIIFECESARCWSLSLPAGAAADDFDQDTLDHDPARVKFAGRVVFGFDRCEGDFVALAGVDLQRVFGPSGGPIPLRR